MKCNVVLAGMMAVICWAGLASAAITGSADVVKVAVTPTVVQAQAGERVAFSIKLDIAKKWHIYAHGDTNYIGVDLVPADEFPLGKLSVEYPKGHEKEFFGEPVFMISGQEEIAVSALVPTGMVPGAYPLQFGVTVQACDDKTCLAPVNVPVTVTLKVQ